LKLSSGLPVDQKTCCIDEICNIGFHPAILLSTRIPEEKRKAIKLRCREFLFFESISNHWGVQATNDSKTAGNQAKIKGSFIRT